MILKSILLILTVALSTPVLAYADDPPDLPSHAGPKSQYFEPAAAPKSARVAPSGTARVITLAKGQNAWFGMLVLEPGATVPLHRDPTEEYLHVVEGGGTLTLNGTEWRLVAGSVVYMAPNDEVVFINGSETTRAYQVFAGPESAAKYDSWPTVSEAEEAAQGTAAAKTLEPLGAADHGGFAGCEACTFRTRDRDNAIVLVSKVDNSRLRLKIAGTIHDLELMSERGAFTNFASDIYTARVQTLEKGMPGPDCVECVPPDVVEVVVYGPNGDVTLTLYRDCGC